MEVVLWVVAAVLASALVVQALVSRRQQVPAAVGLGPDELAALRQEVATVRARLDEREERLGVREERLTDLAAGVQRDREQLQAVQGELESSRIRLAELTSRATAELERVGGCGPRMPGQRSLPWRRPRPETTRSGGPGRSPTR